MRRLWPWSLQIFNWHLPVKSTKITSQSTGTNKALVTSLFWWWYGGPKGHIKGPRAALWDGNWHGALTKAGWDSHEFFLKYLSPFFLGASLKFLALVNNDKVKNHPSIVWEALQTGEPNVEHRDKIWNYLVVVVRASCWRIEPQRVKSEQRKNPLLKLHHRAL